MKCSKQYDLSYVALDDLLFQRGARIGTWNVGSWRYAADPPCPPIGRYWQQSGPRNIAKSICESTMSVRFGHRSLRCQAQYPGNFSGTWRCIRAHVAQGHTGDMQNGAAMKYMATADMLYSKVQSRRMDDATALYYLANALSQGDLEYSATHPAPAFRSFTCHDFGYSTTCY
jgi:hypothetical protein